MRAAPLVVGLDVSGLSEGFRDHASRGIGRYVGHLSHELAALEGDGLRVVRFGHGTDRPGVGAGLVERLPRGRRVVRQQLATPLGVGRLGVQLAHYPAHIDAPAWGRTPTVVTAHDLIPRKRALLDAAGRAERLWQRAEARAVHRAALVITGSSHAASDLVEILGVDRGRIVVIHHGIDERLFASPSAAEVAAARVRIGLPDGRPVLLYLGGIDPRKNMAGLIAIADGVAKRRAAAGSSRPVLVIAGSVSGSEDLPALEALIAGHGLADDVRMPGYVTPQELPAVFAAADVFVFPSLGEGFGLPPLEAMAAGVPVVSSRADSLAEVLGEAALLFDPADPAAGAEAVSAILDDPQAAAARREDGVRWARTFTWARTARQTVEAYERAVSARS